MSMKTIGFVCVLTYFMTPEVFPQTVGEHSGYGYGDRRNGFNSQAGDLRPPLRLERTIGLAGIDNPATLSVFDRFVLVMERQPIRHTLIDRDSGELIWARSLGGPEDRTHFTPAYADGIVLLGGASTVMAVSVSTGAELWSDPAVGATENRDPALVGGLAVYVGSDKLIAAQAETGEVLWEHPIRSAEAPVSLNGRRIFVVDENQALHAVDLLSGQELWVGTGVMDDPVEESSLINQLNTDQAVWVSGLQQPPGEGAFSVVRAVNPATGETLWRKALDVSTIPGLLLAHGRLVGIGGTLFQGRVAVYDPATGDSIWSVGEEGANVPVLPPPGSVLGHAQVAGSSVIYSNSGLKRIQFRDLFTGRLIWSIPVTALAFCTAGERLYVLLEDEIRVYSASHEIFFPHLADGQGQRSLLLLSNGSSTPVSGRVEFFDDDGMPLELEVEGIGLVAAFDFMVGPGASGTFQTTGTGQLNSGWARVVPDGRGVSGSLVLQFSSMPGDIVFEAGVGGAQTSDRAVIPVVNEGGLRTALSVSNPFDIAATLSVKLVDSSGDLKGEVTLEVPPRGHRARFADQLFGELAGSDFRGAIGVESDLPFAITALRTRNGLQLSSVPVGSVR